MAIILGFVPNERGEAAYAKALSLASQLDQELVIINSSGRHSHVDPRLASEPDLEALVSRAAEAGVKARVERDLGEDGPDALIEASHAQDTDMIVIGIRKRSQVGKLLLGSDAQRILLEATCPVLAVKA
jgi:nucleotide-binding universal stress UspA family protein